MNTCKHGDKFCNQRAECAHLSHTTDCCGRHYCNLDCYFNSYHTCTNCNCQKHICEFKSIDASSFTGLCWSCHNLKCAFDRICYRCNRKYEFGKSYDCPICYSHYCSSTCLQNDHWPCPKCGQVFHRCQYNRKGLCKRCSK